MTTITIPRFLLARLKKAAEQQKMTVEEYVAFLVEEGAKHLQTEKVQNTLAASI